MGPPQRERFNSRARSSTAGGSSHKKRARGPKPSRSGVEAIEDAPQELDIVVPKTLEEKEQDRAARIKEQMIADSTSKMSSKKKKRLDGFIAKKLKKEARMDIFDKLKESQATLPSHLLSSLASSSSLGTGNLVNHNLKVAKDEDKQVRRMMSRKTGKRRRVNLEDAHSSEEEEEDWETGKGEVILSGPPSASLPAEEEASVAGSSLSGVTSIKGKEKQQPVQLGGALKTRADGSKAVPEFVPKKDKGKSTPSAWKVASSTSSHFPAENEDDSEDSFDSSDSDNDTDDDDENGASDDEGSSGDDEEEGGADEEEGDASRLSGKRKRAGGFKAWALNQIETVYKAEADADAAQDDAFMVDADALTASSTTVPRPKNPLPTEKIGPLGEALVIPSTSLISSISSIASKHRVTVQRDPDIQERRLLLPVVAEEQSIVETIILNPVTILCGETGSGKTTQVPQFLFEAGFGSPGSDNPGMIGITQPRRVAAMSMASRVAAELSLPSSRVSYQIRYDATTSPSTSIKFMTDGVLLRELAKDFLLSRYSVIIVDEAHERSVNTDVLIGVLSRVSKLREDLWRKGKDGVRPLRIIIMSATLRVTDFSSNTTLFPTPPPVITIATRQHPVTVHFNRRTPTDYLGEAFKKVSKIHSRLPPGGILVFLTGQGEIQSLCRKLEKKFGKKAIDERAKRRQKERERAGGWRATKEVQESDAVDKSQDMKVVATDADVEIEELEFGLDEVGLADDVDAGADSDPEALDSDSDEEEDDVQIIMDSDEVEAPLHILPLYSLLPSDKQMRVFAEPPEGSRLVVVATNVAETSLTIPGIRYVVDCGRAKERRYDPSSGVQSFTVSWISKASASQRAGRAGRTGPGHCYRLYSSPVFENYFDKFAQPEILRMPIEGIVLQMKSMNIDAVINFPFPTPPDRSALTKSERILTTLGALEAPAATKMVGGVVKQGTVGGRITDLGKAMSLFPVSPRYAKMLVSGQQHGCHPYVIASVAVLAVGDPFLREEALGKEDGDEDENDPEPTPEMSLIRSDAIRAKEEKRLKRKAFFQSQAVYTALGNGSSDIFKMLAVVGAYEYDGTGEKFCLRNFVQPKAMQEIHKLRAQMSTIAASALPSSSSPQGALFSPKMSPPNTTQLKIIRQLVASAFIDQLAVRKDILDPSSRAPGAKFTSTRGVAYRAMGVDEDVFIHPSSALFHGDPPEWVVWQDVVRTSKVWIKTVTQINPAWLPSLAPARLLTFSKPLETPKSASSSATAKKLVGSKEGETREAFVIPRFHFTGEGGGKGIELPPMRKIEVWTGGKWVVKVK